MLYVGELFPLSTQRTAAGKSGKNPNAVETDPGGQVGRTVEEALVCGYGSARKIGSGISRKTKEEIGGKLELISFPDHATPGKVRSIVGQQDQAETER